MSVGFIVLVLISAGIIAGFATFYLGPWIVAADIAKILRGLAVSMVIFFAVLLAVAHSVGREYVMLAIVGMVAGCLIGAYRAIAPE